MSSLAFAALLSVIGASPGEDLAKTIVQAGHKKVGVIPSVISQNGEIEATVGNLGPRAQTLARDLHNQLVQISTSGRYRGQFTVVSERVMRQAMQNVASTRSLTIDDLGNPRALRAISRYTGAKGFVTLNFDEEVNVVDVDDDESDDDDDDEDDTTAKKSKSRKRKPYQKLETEYFDDDGDEFSGASYRDVNTLSTAAYMGDSFELRRWNDASLLNVGLRTQHPQFEEDSNWQFGKGDKWEREHFAYLKSDLDHPFDIDGFPYRVEVVVDGEVREPTFVRGKYVVELNEGEEYSVHLENETDQPAMVALFIDGINSIDKELREPADLENARHWVLKGDFKASISGWYVIDSELETQKAEKFEIVDREDSVAAKNGFDENIGLITAIFYVNDASSEQYVDYPEDDLLDGLRSAFGESQFGTGAGDSFDKRLNFVKAERGLMLAAVSIYYRSSSEIDSILAGDTDDIPFDDGDFLAERDDSDDELDIEDDEDEDGDDDKKDDDKKDDDEEASDDDSDDDDSEDDEELIIEDE